MDSPFPGQDGRHSAYDRHEAATALEVCHHSFVECGPNIPLGAREGP